MQHVMISESSDEAESDRKSDHSTGIRCSTPRDSSVSGTALEIDGMACGSSGIVDAVISPCPGQNRSVEVEVVEAGAQVRNLHMVAGAPGCCEQEPASAQLSGKTSAARSSADAVELVDPAARKGCSAGNLDSTDEQVDPAARKGCSAGDWCSMPELSVQVEPVYTGWQAAAGLGAGAVTTALADAAQLFSDPGLLDQGAASVASQLEDWGAQCQISP